MKNSVINWIVFGLAFGIIIILSIISTNDLTTNESTLLGVLLTILSVIASWIVSSYFSRNSQREAIEEVKLESQNNLRTYALNAAEKVNNLSNELSKLSLYLRSELEKDDNSDEYALYSKIERIESAIHIINTLKSVNDTSLSDWKGVIGDELEVREEEKEEREERLLQITENIESILQNQNSTKKKESSEEIIFIKRQLEQLGKSIGSTSLSTRTNSKKPGREKVEKPCPNCQATISFTQRENVNGYKTIKCTNCDKRALSRFSLQDGFYLTAEQFIHESFNCPICNEIITEALSNIPLSKEIISCNNCKNKIKTVRNLDMGITISTFGNPTTSEITSPTFNVKLNPELLELVEKQLPPQPWPKFIHKTVAEQLNISNKTANRCITELTNLGRVNPQINGVVYVKSDLKKEDIDEK